MTDVATTQTARARRERIRLGMHSFIATRRDIADAYRERDWETLGHDSWEAYIAAEFSEAQLRLTSDERREAVAELRLEGMSQRAIGAALGVDAATVNRDLRGVAIATPDEITGADGKTYAATRPTTPTPGPSDAAIARPLVGPGTNQAPEAPGEPDEFAAWSDDERDLLKRLRDGETVVVSHRNHASLIVWAIDAGLFERVDRRTPWGNPFEMPADGERMTVISNYQLHYLPNKPSLLERIGSLHGKALGCWCAPEPCHADVLRAWADNKEGQCWPGGDGAP